MNELGVYVRMEQTESNVHDEYLVRCHVQGMRTGAFSDAGNVSNVLSIALKRIPSTFSQTVDFMIAHSVSNTRAKEFLQSLHVTGASNAALPLKRFVVGCKMVQRQVSLESLFAATSTSEKCIQKSETARVRCLPRTTGALGRLKEASTLLDQVKWMLGDVPLFENGQVLIGQPAVLTENQITSTVTPRYPPLEAAEYALLLHVLGDSTMNSTRNSLMKLRGRTELDKERRCEWTEKISPLFNDSAFKPERVTDLAGGVALDVINGLDPAVLRFKRHAQKLNDHFGLLKYRLNTSICNYERSGQREPDSLPSFCGRRTWLMYAFFFFRQYPIITKLAVRSLPLDSQQKVGLLRLQPQNLAEERIRRATPRKRIMTSSNPTIRVAGMESFTEAIRSAFSTSGTASAVTDPAHENIITTAEAASASSKAVKDALSAIEQEQRFLMVVRRKMTIVTSSIEVS